MSCHAFIFARGGSKGLPKKNIKLLAGKPLICYSIEVAQQASQIDKVFVSTDDSEIAAIAEQAGAIIIDRPSELASDHAPERLAWQHAVQWAIERYGEFNYFVSLPATSPLRDLSDIESAINHFHNSAADTCIAISPSSRSPFFNMVKRDATSAVELLNKATRSVSRRQDAPAVYDITTVVYVSKPEVIARDIGLFDGVVVSIEVPKERAVDIDDIYDFYLAEAIIKNKGKQDVK